MACGCQCTCPSSSNRTYQQSPNWNSMLSSKLVSKPGMSLRFMEDAVGAMEIVDVEAGPTGQRLDQSPVAVSEST